MKQHSEKLDLFNMLLEQKTDHDGIYKTASKYLMLAKSTIPRKKSSEYSEPIILIVGKGKKSCKAGSRQYLYGSGELLIIFLPMPLETALIDASPESPFLAAGIRFDIARMTRILHRIEQIEGTYPRPATTQPSGIISCTANDQILDPVIRLIVSLSKPGEVKFFEEAIIDEIYYRILNEAMGGDLRSLLQNQGQIHHISKAVQFIHDNIEKPVSVDSLAEMVYMSRTVFFNTFKKVMHITPLQYVKSVKLLKANSLLASGKRVNEAGFLVGYNSTAQFSREYKRYFGINPSATELILSST